MVEPPGPVEASALDNDEMKTTREHTNTAEGTFQDRRAPVFHRDMFMSLSIKFRIYRNSNAIEILPGRNTGQMEECRRQIHVGSYRILNMTLRNTRSADEKRNSDILLKPTSFPGRQTMLTDMESIVRSVDNVSIIQLTTVLKPGNKRLNELINALQGTQSRAIKVIIVIDNRLVQLRQIANPTNPARLQRVRTADGISITAAAMHSPGQD